MGIYKMEELALAMARASGMGMPSKEKRSMPCPEPKNMGTSVLDEAAADQIMKDLAPHQAAWKAELMNAPFNKRAEANPLPEVHEFWFSAAQAEHDLNDEKGMIFKDGDHYKWQQRNRALNFALLADGRVEPYTLCGQLGRTSRYLRPDAFHLGQGMYLGRCSTLQEAQAKAKQIKESISWEICRRACEANGLMFGGPSAPPSKRSPAI